MDSLVEHPGCILISMCVCVFGLTSAVMCHVEVCTQLILIAIEIEI